MAIVCKGIRSVVLETLGVVTIVVLLLAAATWTANQSGGNNPVEVGAARQWIRQVTREITASLTPSLPQSQRERYVEQRLGHYSQLYREAAREYVQKVLREQPKRPVLAKPEAIAPTSQLLGTL